MLNQGGNEQLKSFSEGNDRESVTEVTPGVWFVLGLGHSNAIFIEGQSSTLLIDTLDTLERGEKLREIIRQKIGKPVKTILYTHQHPDHRGGAGAFVQSEPEIIAFEPKNPVLERSSLLQDIQDLRGGRQFGYSLSDREAISQGIGRREGIVHGEHRAFVPPTTIYDQDRVVRNLDGIQAELVRLPGEAEEQIMIWLPEKETLCCGDNYYGCFPNLYAIRGRQYRDLAMWIHSLDVLMTYPAKHLLLGHTAALSGTDVIQNTLGNFRSAFDFILTRTLEGMNAGKSPDQLASEIQLPSKIAELSTLAEHYGCLEWTVRSIYTAYLGWFDGNPTHLHPLSPEKHSQKLIALAGGPHVLLNEAQNSMVHEDYQWCLELCDILLSHKKTSCKEALQLKIEALEKIAELETSANGRHYYLVCAQELRKQELPILSEIS